MAPKRRFRKPPLEVLSQTDGAWYDGDVSLEGSRLWVHFSGFGNEVDEFWDGECLKSPTKVREIVRLRSKQLQDSNCTDVTIGMIVCANFKSPDHKESKYYDAKVLGVYHNAHSFQKTGKKELCTCQFKLAWEAGPSKNKEVFLGCGDISFIDVEGVEKHPVVHQVLQAAFVCAQQLANEHDEKLDQAVSIEDVEVQPEQVLPLEDVQVQFVQELPMESVQVQLEQVLLFDDMQMQLEQVLPVEDVQVAFEQVLRFKDVQMQLEQVLPVEDVQFEDVEEVQLDQVLPVKDVQVEVFQFEDIQEVQLDQVLPVEDVQIEVLQFEDVQEVQLDPILPVEDVQVEVLQFEDVQEVQLEQVLPMEDDQVEVLQFEDVQEVHLEQVLPVEDVQVQLEQDLQLGLEEAYVQLDQVPPMEDVQMQPEQVLPTENVQVQIEHDFLFENVQVHYVDTLFDETPSEERNEGLFTSCDMDKLPEDMAQKVKNYNIFHDFLGEQADKLKEALDMFNARNNFSCT